MYVYRSGNLQIEGGSLNSLKDRFPISEIQSHDLLTIPGKRKTDEEARTF